MITLRPAHERGHADHGWLNTWHTFSFNTYHDARWSGFRTLRVINDDIVQPGQGFGMHPHRDMEIITYILDGAIEHKDSMGNGSVIRPGDVQRMSAGTGVMHSEFTPSESEPVHLLQIWLFPNRKGLAPSYEQKTFARTDKLNRLRLIASPDGAHESVTIHQDARVYAGLLEERTRVHLPLEAHRHAWLHVARGAVRIGTHDLKSGDGAALSEEPKLELTAMTESEVLVFDLA
ncbi:MAG: pirin family protein [candidate division Zixibacteria bacterium]|nr:pirin family protein [candidate division Zixibacteria bacterium]